MVVDFYNKDILIWGIQRAGFHPDEFLVREANVNDWLNNVKQPTTKQLEKIAKKLNLPFGYLFLDSPPKEEISFPFFRTNGNSAGEKQVSLNVFDTIKILENRQDWLRDYLLENGNEPLGFIGKFNSSVNPTVVSNHIRTVLGLNALWARECNTWEDALNFLTTTIENAGIIVTFNGVVGNSTKRHISVEECRGFVLVDKIVPFMFVNNSDSKAAQIFTIAHELAHIWIGCSAGFDFRDMKPANNIAEIFCDNVAAEFLVPAEIFKSEWEHTQNFTALNKIFKVSPIVVARRALDLGFISEKDFFEFYNEYIENEFYKKKENQGGGDFYLTAKKRISPTFAAYVDSGVKSGRLLYNDAYKLLGINGNTFDNFMNKI